MGVFKLQLEDFSTTEYELIAIHTSIEVTKLAYLLNKNLDTKFHQFDSVDKTVKKEKGSFERYLFYDKENDIQWNLVENKSVIKGKNNSESLYHQFGQTMNLISEFKMVDYIVKIDSEESSIDIDEVIRKMSKIKTISLSYLMDKNKIKTKSNLIF